MSVPYCRLVSLLICTVQLAAPQRQEGNPSRAGSHKVRPVPTRRLPKSWGRQSTLTIPPCNRTYRRLEERILAGLISPRHRFESGICNSNVLHSYTFLSVSFKSETKGVVVRHRYNSYLQSTKGWEGSAKEEVANIAVPYFKERKTETNDTEMGFKIRVLP